jgi:hypothetical protein
MAVVGGDDRLRKMLGAVFVLKIKTAMMSGAVFVVETLGMTRRVSPGLSVIDALAMRDAISEFNKQGRAKFLKRYGFSRSSKFYLIHGQRLYDVKALVAAAYRYATGKTLRHTEFSGGTQTQAVFRRLAKQDSSFIRVFEDRFGELRNLSNEYDRIPRAWTDLRELGFSKWIPLGNYADLNTGWLPGVYVIANSGRQPHEIPIINNRVVYIGETVDQSLRQRLYQLHRSMIEGKTGHSGGLTLRAKNYHRKTLWLAIRSFPLGYGLEDAFAQSFRSAQVRHLERTLLYEYVHTVHAYPPGNTK